MRGIFSSFLPFMLTLLLVQAVSAQNVTIELTPITYPIVLPDSGGSFDYLLTVTNQGATITATVWCMAPLPNGTSWGPVVGPATQTLAAGQTLSIHRTQSIPPRAPFGHYALHAYVGIYPDTIWSQDGFEFQHQAISGTEQEWAVRYNGLANSGEGANSVVVDAVGNVYVTGRSSGIGTNIDYATLKYDADGNQVWVARYNGPGNNEDWANSLAVDGDGNIYVTGASGGSGTGNDYATVKYDASGNQIWVARYNGPGNGGDVAYSLAVDGGGNVYVTGYSDAGGTGYDYTTVKYDALGHQLWVARYNGPGNGWDEAYSLAVDSSGNVYVAGFSDGGETNDDYATVKYNSAGVEQWVAGYNGPGNQHDQAYSLAVDGLGNVYVTGRSGGSGTSLDYTTVKYDALGYQRWVARYNGPANYWDEAFFLAVDGGGNVYVTGRSWGGGTSYFDYATVKYDASGNQIWVARYNGPGNEQDQAYSLAVDGGGNVYVAGFSYGGETHEDYATVKYDASGNQVWVARYNGPGNSNDEAYSLAIDGGGNVYVTGQSYGSGTNDDYCTIKYSGGNIDNWMPVEATVLGQPLPQECRLEGNYPNPFNSKTVARYELRVPSVVSLRVYDTAGRLVATLVDGWRSAGVHELTWEAGQMAAGMYFARLEAGEYVGVQKLILLK